jgi:hypothetical protein
MKFAHRLAALGASAALALGGVAAANAQALEPPPGQQINVTVSTAGAQAPALSSVDHAFLLKVRDLAAADFAILQAEIDIAEGWPGTAPDAGQLDDLTAQAQALYDQANPLSLEQPSPTRADAVVSVARALNASLVEQLGALDAMRQVDPVTGQLTSSPGYDVSQARANYGSAADRINALLGAS